MKRWLSSWSTSPRTSTVISSRTDPPLAPGSAEGQGEMNEIRTEQLAFTEEEAECLLNERRGWTSALMISLFCWSVQKGGLRNLPGLTLLAEQGGQARLHQSFRGSNRYIVGLLGEEVLATSPRK